MDQSEPAGVTLGQRIGQETERKKRKEKSKNEKNH
jgi:hypothetical protein